MNKDYHYIFFCHVKDRVLNRQSYLKIWDPEHVVLRGVYTTIQFSVVDPDPSSKNITKNRDFYYFVTFIW